MTTHPYAFRLATYIIELIERRKYTIEKAFTYAISRHNSIKFQDEAFALSENTLKHFAVADFILRENGYTNIPLRKKAAFRVAYYLASQEIASQHELGFISGGLLPKKLIGLLSRGNIEDILTKINTLSPVNKFSLLYSIPPWIVEILVRYLDIESVKKILEKSKSRIYWLRINTLKASSSKVIKRMEKHGIDLIQDKDFPFLYKVQRIKSISIFRKICRKHAQDMIIQDKGSILVVKALEPRKSDVILDLTAAPGLKTSLIQQITNNSSRIIAVDLSPKRLLEEKRILNILSVKNVSLIASNGTLIRLRKKFNKILLDAPCSNSGALRNDPALRLSLWNKPSIKVFHRIQGRLLYNTINHLLSDNGILVYSTCSFSPKEGEKHFDQISSLKLETDNIPGLPGYSGFKCKDDVKRIFPYPHDTIGFFIARAINS
ncbi:MAG: hypothetical protein B6U94_01710 [Thermofilum sp. ex4484_79]|nr:MAG: hypothetical protein B6U94_01710 [Thermofilum sp. ex4484_79]